MTFAVVDGGLSTALESLGHHPAGLLWTAQLVVEQPEVVVAAHRLFVDAGAEIVITSSYQASVAGFERAGLSRADAVRTLASTTELARRSGAATVAASVGPFGATLGDGSEYHGRYEATWDEVRAFHRERIAVLIDTAPDLMAVETIPGRVEAEIVLDELQRAGAPRAWLTMSCVDEVHTCAGDVFADVVAVVSPAVFAVGVNCTAPPLVSPLLASARPVTDLPFVVYPNHGRAWDADHECWVGDGDDHLVERLGEWVKLGAGYIGGCCGVGPDGIARIVEARADR